MILVLSQAILALPFSLLVGRGLIPFLRRLRFGQVVRSDGPGTHLAKQGTPTMGGLIFLIPFMLLAPILVYIQGGSLVKFSALALLTTGFAIIGLIDDWKKVVLKRPLGLKAREKLFGQILVAGASCLLLALGGQPTSLVIPLTGWHLEMGFAYWVFASVFALGFGNAVNITDGVDGLAAGTSAIAALFFLGTALMAGDRSLSAVSLALIAALLGFLTYNRHPARVFMGDVGSLGLGGALAGLAIISRYEVVFLVVGGVFVFEALSVTIQVLYFRYTGGKRFFRMAPFHHHLELIGWTEEKIVGRFYLASLTLTLIGVLIFTLSTGQVMQP